MILFKNNILSSISSENKLSQKLQNTKWFENHFFSGGFIFITNAIFFSLVIIFLLNFPGITMLDFFIMGGATLLSIWFWSLINRSWKGSKGNRIKMASIGSSFYILVGLFFLYKLMTLKPSYPGDDTFMAGLGLLFAIVVSSVAWITCFLFTAFPKKEKLV
jgi:hypothetical protein